MSEEKNIDRLFQEKLKDFEVAPNDAVWKNIATRVQPKKKKRRIIPIWLRLTGAAASLVLLFSLANLLFFENIDELPVENNPIIVEEDGNSGNNDLIEDENNKLNIIEESTIANAEKEESNNETNKVLSKNQPAQIVNVDVGDSEELIVANSSKEDPEKAKDRNTKLETTLALESLEGATNVVSSSESKEDVSSTNKEEVYSIEEAITEAAENNPEEIIDDASKLNRWSIIPSVAPVYFNTLGEGSSIHSDFSSNPKSGDINMSYGITASYAVTEKFSVRTGLNKVKMGYSTNDIFLYSSLYSGISNSRYNNIDLDSKSGNISFLSGSAFNGENSILSDRRGTIEQEFGFLEVPLELEYKVLNNKLGINVIGGFSALFLENNSISIIDGQSTLSGTATNINKTSYSANFGLGFNYKMSRKFNLNLEPVFKYQLNTFENTYGEFKPYFIGFYSGFKFKF